MKSNPSKLFSDNYWKEYIDVLYQEFLNTIFDTWYKIYIDKDKDFQINVYLINELQLLCQILADRGFSKVEIRKLNKNKNSLTAEVIDKNYSKYFNNNLLNSTHCKALKDIGSTDTMIKSLFLYIYEILKNNDINVLTNDSINNSNKSSNAFIQLYNWLLQ